MSPDPISSRVARVTHTREDQSEMGSKRYDSLGGLANVARQYGSGDATLTQIARSVGCSDVTVRKDILRLCGEDGYKRLRQERRLRAAIQDAPESLPLVEAIANARNLRRRASSGELWRLDAEIALMEALEREDIDALVTNVNKRFLISLGSRPLQVRYASPDRSLTEHRFGLHRFKARGDYAGSVPVVFVLTPTGAPPSFYCFYASDLGGIRSLVLRFEFFQRGSKYDFARNRWAILRGTKDDASLHSAEETETDASPRFPRKSASGRKRVAQKRLHRVRHSR